MDIEIFLPFHFAVTSFQNLCIPFCIVINLIHSLRIMWLPVVEIQYDDAYVLIYASLWELKESSSWSWNGTFKTIEMNKQYINDRNDK